VCSLELDNTDKVDFLLFQVAIHVLPCPTFVLVCQLGSSAFFVKICDLLGLVQADSFEWEKIKKFAFVAFAFLATLYFNIKVLQVRTQPQCTSCHPHPQSMPPVFLVFSA
jgi:hypothetical protein